MTNYTLIFDDSGTKTFHVGPGQPGWFAQGGYLIANSDITELKRRITEFRQKWSGVLGKDLPPLHSSDIRSKKDGFEFLKDKALYDQFLSDVFKLICDTPIHIIATIIDIEGYLNYVKSRGHEGSDIWGYYKSAYPILIERSLKYVNRLNPEAILSVEGEKTGKKEDKAIELLHKELKEKGTQDIFVSDSAKKYSTGIDPKKLGGLTFVSKEALLPQIADIVLFALCKTPYTLRDNSEFYRTFTDLSRENKLVNNYLNVTESKEMGIKYYLFSQKIITAILEHSCKKT